MKKKSFCFYAEDVCIREKERVGRRERRARAYEGWVRANACCALSVAKDSETQLKDSAFQERVRDFKTTRP